LESHIRIIRLPVYFVFIFRIDCQYVIPTHNVGIIITLLLSVFERQRELGLLRAVGMTRKQVRTTVRWESVITSLLGAVTGIILGIGLGWVIVFALRDQGLSSFQIPIGTTIFIMVMSFFVGLSAAIYPAWRATKVDILSALNTN
jgi:putative ABC transport system permease protein